MCHISTIKWVPKWWECTDVTTEESRALIKMMCLAFQGAWGGGLLMSRKHKWKLNGVERYDLLVPIKDIYEMHFNILVIAIAVSIKIKGHCYLWDRNCPSSWSSNVQCLCATVAWQFVLKYKQQTFHACFSVLPPYIHRSRVVSAEFSDLAPNVS